MAESILFDIATEVLKQIGSLVGREVSLLWNLESDLESLAGTLSTIQAVLLDAEKKQAHNHQLRDWLGKLKDVLLDAEDVLEEFEFQAPGREVVRQKRSTSRKVRQFFSSSNPVVLRSQISHKIKQIRERLDRIAELCGEEFLQLIVDNSRSVRSVVLPIADKYGDAPILRSFISEDISKFKYLRLLLLYGILFEELPNSIGTLRHLRYLDLAQNSSLKKIPESICELQKLQMLRLQSCYQLKKLPNNIRKMISLRYLQITTQEEVLPENEIGWMQGLKSLRALHIENTSVSSLPNTIKYLTKLEMLVISLSHKLNLKMELQAEDLDLRLSLKKFIVYNLDSLVDLPQLLFQASAGTLKYIEIGTCKNLKALPEWFENLTSLEKLDIADCPRLSPLPEGIKRLTSLKELKIRGCPDLESCRNDESKIAHIQLNLSEPLTETAGPDEVIGDLKRKLELFQTKVSQAVSVLKPQLSSESQSSAVAAIQELEALAKMDISTPLKEDTQVAQSQPPEQQQPPQPPPL
ncbi:hypothetical protein Pint_17024 [Pistacia integerrima]|uniref:Uncharacterized protein n=1 Tax=Pistacia integerrima TaxID=434235 RepID=A0ACC0Z9S6_9ROSI|nr:hypothetical protein Pint_17024 [Pistacia integerrima]